MTDTTALAGAPGTRNADECFNCGEAIRRSIDPAVPWVHEHSGNSFCEVRARPEAGDPTGAGSAIGLQALRADGYEAAEAEPSWE